MRPGSRTLRSRAVAGWALLLLVSAPSVVRAHARSLSSSAWQWEGLEA